MSIHSFSTQAKEPIEFGGDPALATSHLPSPGRALTEVEARELGAICDTTADAAERAQHGRDWWPLSLRCHFVMKFHKFQLLSAAQRTHKKCPPY